MVQDLRRFSRHGPVAAILAAEAAAILAARDCGGLGGPSRPRSWRCHVVGRWLEGGSGRFDRAMRNRVSLSAVVRRAWPCPRVGWLTAPHSCATTTASGGAAHTARLPRRPVRRVASAGRDPRPTTRQGKPVRTYSPKTGE